MARILHVRPNRTKVVPEEVVDAGERARRIVSTAEADALRVHEEAWARGFEAGKFEALRDQLDAAIARDRALAEAQPLIVQLALSVAAKLLQRAIDVEPERVIDVVYPLLVQLRRAKRVVIRVHPEDAHTLRRWIAQVLPERDTTEAIQFDEDASLTRGGCVVSSERGTLDARIEVQLSALQHALGTPR